MELNEAKNKFIQAWGTLGSNWGINKAMAQIHALLLLATEPLSAEDIMQELQMSRGNVNMNLRALMDWGIVKKDLKVGERKEYQSMKISVTSSRGRLSRYVENPDFVQGVVENIKAIRETIGPKVDMGIELHGDHQSQTSMLLIKALEPFQPWFFCY